MWAQIFQYIKPCHVEVIFRKHRKYFDILSFINTETVDVVEISRDIATDDLATQGAKTPAAMELLYYEWYIPRWGSQD